MKRWFTILLVLLLFCGTSRAESLAQRVGAPKTFQATYTSNTGKSTVLVHAEVYVPETEHINTFAVSGRDVTLQDVKAVALAAAPETDWLADWQVSPLSYAKWSGNRDDYFYEEENEYGRFGTVLAFKWYPQDDGSEDYAPYKYGHFQAGVQANNIFRTTVFGARRTEARLEYYYTQIKEDSASFYAHSPYLEKNDGASKADSKLDGQSLTWGEATAMAQTMMTRVAPDFTLAWVGQAYGEGTTRKAYAFRFLRVVDGVPVTYAQNAHTGDEPDAQHYTSPPKLENISCVVDQERIVAVEWNSPWEIRDTLQTDVALMPFDQIMEIFGTICPLSIQSMENENQVMGGERNRWEISEIRLGYMPVLRKDNSGEWELRPVWDFIGTRIFAHEYYDELGNTALTLDAIDGTVIDRAYGY